MHKIFEFGPAVQRPTPPVNSHDEMRVSPQRPLPPPMFADYAPANEKVAPSPGGLRRPVDLEEQANVEDERGRALQSV